MNKYLGRGNYKLVGELRVLKRLLILSVPPPGRSPYSVPPNSLLGSKPPPIPLRRRRTPYFSLYPHTTNSISSTSPTSFFQLLSHIAAISDIVLFETSPDHTSEDKHFVVFTELSLHVCASVVRLPTGLCNSRVLMRDRKVIAMWDFRSWGLARL